MTWIISFITILSMELTLRKHWFGWALCLLNQVLWFAYIYSRADWGLLPLNIAMWIQAIRGISRWREEALTKSGETCSSKEYK